MRLKDRVAIVTGSSSGIGRGVSLEFAREGAKVVVADIQEAPKQGIYHETEPQAPTVEEVEKLGGQGLFVQLDVSNEESVVALIDSAVEKFGALDILVNNAGILIPGNSQEISVADWDRVMGINLRGLFLTTKFALPHIKKSPNGRIINIASVHAFGPSPASRWLASSRSSA